MNGISTTLLSGPMSEWLSKDIDLSVVPIIVSQLIVAIEKLVSGRGRGPYKKQILTETLHAILRETNHEDLIPTVDAILPQLIDTMVTMKNTHLQKCCTIS